MHHLGTGRLDSFQGKAPTSELLILRLYVSCMIASKVQLNLQKAKFRRMRYILSGSQNVMQSLGRCILQMADARTTAGIVSVVLAAVVFFAGLFWRIEQQRRDREALLATLEQHYSGKVRGSKGLYLQTCWRTA
jgi:hypothetical protein